MKHNKPIIIFRYRRFPAILFAFLLAMLIMESCKKFVTIDPPRDEVSSSTAFSDDNTATASVVGIYNDIMQTTRFLSYNITVDLGQYADELTYWDAAGNPFLNNALLPDNTDINDMWNQAYNYIYHVNACLEGLSKAENVSEAVKNQLLGECKFLRALNYFYLVNLFGDAPLVTTTDYKTNAVLPRVPVADIYQQIIADLKDAQTLLSEAYTDNERIRPNKWAATALLARAYLYSRDWADAIAQSTQVINSGIYTPLPDVSDVFLKTSKETIWQLMPVNRNYNTFEGNNFIPFDLDPNYPVSPSLLNDFEPNDLRRAQWVGTINYQNKDYYFPYKYKIASGYSPLNEYYIVLRVSEQFLIRAEANAQAGSISEAVNDLNIIRVRAGLLPISTNISPTDCLNKFYTRTG